MRDCKDCPHNNGTAFERDCCFPDCVGGWEEVSFSQSARIEQLQAENEQLKKIVESSGG